ncbi:MAG: hypothetical protein QF662_05880, partial [Phycisphaerae bacterium]|nr:hypothetical protein [Phycisphaerae bacterium]
NILTSRGNCANRVLRVGLLTRRESNMARCGKAIRLIVLLLLLLLAIGFWLYKSPPGYYVPRSDVPREMFDEWGNRFNIQISNVVNALFDESGGTPIDVTFTEDAVNGWLRTFGADIVKNLPEGISDPCVSFTTDRVALAVRWSEGWAETVLSAELAISLPEPDRVVAKLVSVRAGRLPIPQSLVQEAFVKHVGRLLESGVLKGDVHFAAEKARLLFEGIPLRLERRKYRVDLERLEITPGKLHVTGRRISLKK